MSGPTLASGPTPSADPAGKAVNKRRKQTVERSFADAKQLFGHRYARFTGLVRVSCQCLLAAAAQNIRKIALVLTRKPPLRTA
jgi:IS5 family transposase